jgi:hypothetical protein
MSAQLEVEPSQSPQSQPGGTKIPMMLAVTGFNQRAVVG